MNKVVTINLAGRAFSIEEEGCETLNAYLKEAEGSLADNPDKTEILADIESALAEKCATYLNAGKNVVTSEEAQQIVKEMGPIAGSGETTAGSARSTPKRLYRIPEGAVIWGVCNGIAAYFNVDVTLVRIIFILIGIFTSGGFCFAYFLMMLFIPEAHTPSQRAASMGGIPTAQEIIDTVKKAYDTGAHEWSKWQTQSHAEHLKWKDERRKWKQEYRQQWRYQQNWNAYRSPFWEFMQSILGLVWFVLLLWLCWWSYNHLAIAHDLFNQIGMWLRTLGAWIEKKI